jgi:hypothetical protein
MRPSDVLHINKGGSSHNSHFGFRSRLGKQRAAYAQTKSGLKNKDLIREMNKVGSMGFQNSGNGFRKFGNDLSKTTDSRPDHLSLVIDHLSFQ